MPHLFEDIFFHLDPACDSPSLEEQLKHKRKPATEHEKRIRSHARLAVWNALSDVRRDGWTAAGMLGEERDSIAAHSFSVSALSAILALLVASKVEQPNKDRTRAAVTRGISLGNTHDWLETLVPDVNTLLKRAVKPEIGVQEERAQEYLLNKLLAANPTIAQHLQALLNEEDQKISLAAQLTKVADLVDAQVWRAVAAGQFHGPELRTIAKGMKMADPIADALLTDITNALVKQASQVAKKRLIEPWNANEKDPLNQYRAVVMLAALLQQAKTKTHQQFQRARIGLGDLPSEAYIGSIALTIIDTFFRDYLQETKLSDVIPEALILTVLDTLQHTTAGGITQGWMEEERTKVAMREQQGIVRKRLLSFLPTVAKEELEKNFDLDNPLAKVIARSARLAAYSSWATKLPGGYHQSVQVVQAQSHANAMAIWDRMIRTSANRENPYSHHIESLKSLMFEVSALLHSIVWVRKTPSEINASLENMQRDSSKDLFDIADFHPTI